MAADERATAQQPGRDPAREAGPTTPVPETRATYRALLLRGLSTAEAADLTAWLAGLPTIPGQPWTVAQVDRLLFLRDLWRTGRLGADDRVTPIATG